MFRYNRATLIETRGTSPRVTAEKGRALSQFERDMLLATPYPRPMNERIWLGRIVAS
jgi:hypothetical protein